VTSAAVAGNNPRALATQLAIISFVIVFVVDIAGATEMCCMPLRMGTTKHRNKR
jgi:hypothetical protein